MKKEAKMIEKKQEEVEKRKVLLKRACEELIEENCSISYKKAFEKTKEIDTDGKGIPVKTLERNPYKDMIYYYKNIITRNEKERKEIRILRDEIKYLHKVIKQLNKENHELKTHLYYEGKI